MVDLQNERPAKRAKLDSSSSTLTRSHPFNIKPTGNQLMPDAAPSCRPNGLGTLNNVFDDEQFLALLHYLNISELILISRCSRALFVFAHEEEFYKAAVLDQTRGHFAYQGSWRLTYIYQYTLDKHGVNTAEQVVKHQLGLQLPLINGFYSDTLFASYYCSSLDLRQFDGDENVDRIDITDYDEARLLRDYLIPNRPVVMTGIVNKWKAAQWNENSLEQEFGSVSFKVGAYEMTMKEYLQYSRSTLDEAPLYLFDSGYIEKCPSMESQFEPPVFARSDLFQMLEDIPAFDGYNDGCEDRDTPGAQGGNMTSTSARASTDRAEPSSTFGSMRPAFRWILIGPPRSGSTFHKDPNHTSAWNGLISGKKRWILYPPDCPPPGIFVSGDGRDVVTPISVTEWFANFYRDHRALVRRVSKSNAVIRDSVVDAASLESLREMSNPSSYPGYGPIECVCEPGDLILIPNGWWHIALNEAPSIALTANYVSNQNLLNVCQFLTEEGNDALEHAFRSQVDKKLPGLIDRLMSKQVELEEQRHVSKPVSLWASMC